MTLKCDLKPPRFEVWNARRGIFLSPKDKWVFNSWEEVIKFVHWRRKHIRVRTFYDRHLKRRVIQVLAGDGWGIRI